MTSNTTAIQHNLPIFVTGCAGFIGFHLSHRLLQDGCTVVGIDNINNYYDVRLKEMRLTRLRQHRDFFFEKIDIVDRGSVANLFSKYRPKLVVHLAAQAGVRYSLTHPHAYADTNIAGFLNILEGCRQYEIEHLLYASSSSVYGMNTGMPFSVGDNVDHPVSLYAASKKANELMAHTYSHLYRIPTTGLRFFTVYGPWGRPDMAMFIFTERILKDEPIDVFNHGKMLRDFTYIDDIIEGVRRLIDHLPTPLPGWSGDNPTPGASSAPYRVHNIGNNRPVGLMEMIETLERVLGKKAKKRMLPMQSGDVQATAADIGSLVRAVDFAPNTSIEDGIARFVSWHKEHWQPLSIAI